LTDILGNTCKFCLLVCLLSWKSKGLPSACDVFI